jgi:hypothetical protein
MQTYKELIFTTVEEIIIWPSYQDLSQVLELGRLTLIKGVAYNLTYYIVESEILKNTQQTCQLWE